MHSCRAIAIAAGLLLWAMPMSPSQAVAAPISSVAMQGVAQGFLHTSGANVQQAQYYYYPRYRRHYRYRTYRYYAPRCWNQRIIVRDYYGRAYFRTVRRCR